MAKKRLLDWGNVVDAMQVENDSIRTFDTGATRDTDEGKPEFSGFLSPDVMIAFGQYMHDHRYQADGTLRASDNWKKGIPKDVYLESMFRHFIDVWKLHELEKFEKAGWSDDMIAGLCALFFNVQGYLHEYLKGVGR